MKTYKAIICDKGPRIPGQHVSVLAENLDDARKKLEAKYGVGKVFYLRDEEEENRIR